jgi:hypothetical protein
MTLFTTKDLMDLINVAEFAVALEERAIAALTHDADGMEERLDRRQRLDRWRKTIAGARTGVIQR